MKTKALFFFLVCLCALTLGFDAQAKVGDVIWQKPSNYDLNSQVLDPFNGDRYESNIDGYNAMASHDCALAAFSKDGVEPLWKVVGGSMNQLYSIGSTGFCGCGSITVAKDGIYVYSPSGGGDRSETIQKRSKKNGALIWTREMGHGYTYVNDISATTRGVYLRVSVLDPSYGNIYFGTQNGIVKLNPETGEEIWSKYMIPFGIGAHDGEKQDFLYSFNGYDDPNYGGGLQRIYKKD